MNEEYYLLKENGKWLMYLVTEDIINMIARSPNFMFDLQGCCFGMRSIYTIEYAYGEYLDDENTAKDIFISECEIAEDAGKNFKYEQISKQAAKKILFLLKL